MDYPRTRVASASRAIVLVTAVGVAGLVLGACAPAGQTSPTPAPATKAAATTPPAPAAQAVASPSPAVAKPAASPSPVTGPATVAVRQHPSIGMYLADGQGRSLYLFTRDEPNKSNCSGNCAQTWPLLLTRGQPMAGQGINASLLGTMTRDDGGVQVTYNRWPLYYYAPDQQPGDTRGQNVGGVWFLVSPQGEAIRS